MSTFNHPNVLTLKGVCLDGGPAPYIIMPYMANGSLLTYLKGNRKTLIATSEDVKEDVSELFVIYIERLINKNQNYLKKAVYTIYL